MTLKPLPGRVLILPDEIPDTTPSGLSIVRHWNPEVTGTVSAIGPAGTCPRCDGGRHPGFVEGDHVIYSYQSGQDIVLKDTRYLMMRIEDVLCVLEDRTPDGES